MLKTILGSSLYHSGLVPIIKNIFGKDGTVIYFHAIYDTEDNTSWCQEESLLMQKELFQRLLEYLSRHYKFVSLDEAVRSHSGDVLAITFDDGFRGIYDHAYPILKSMGATATVFLITGLIGSNRLPWSDELLFRLKCFFKLSEREKVDLAANLSPEWKLLLLKNHDVGKTLEAFKAFPKKDREELLAFLNGVWPNSYTVNNRIFLSIDEIREMHANGISFGSHTKEHSLLTWLDQKKLFEELIESKSKVLQITGAKQCWFAYPDGVLSRREEEAVKEIGYVGAVKTFRCPQHFGHFAFPRISLKKNDILGLSGGLSPSQVEFSLFRHWLRNYHGFRSLRIKSVRPN